MRSSWSRSVVAVALVAVGAAVAAGCGSGDTTQGATEKQSTHNTASSGSSGSSVRSTTTDAASTTTATTAPPPTTASGGAVDAGDYEGQLYDFGEIKAVTRSGAAVSISFDREQIYDDSGNLVSGTQLTQEPVIYGSTDVPYVNDSTKLRRFTLASSVRVLRIDDPVPCASDDPPGTPSWRQLSVDQLVAGAWHDRLMDALTFGPDGLVTQVRLSTAC